VPIRSRFLLVHGAFHGAWCFAALQAELDRRGFASYSVDLPGHGASISALTDLYGDADCVARAVGCGRPCTRRAQSRGAVITEAAHRPLRSAAAGPAHLVYLAALCPDAGEGGVDLLASLPPGEIDPMWEGIAVDEAAMTITVDDPAVAVDHFHRCCDPAAAAAACARLDAQSLVSANRSSKKSWRDGAATVSCLTPIIRRFCR
jgi:pimeloyl-ACP methyl ester carboxylesterase